MFSMESSIKHLMKKYHQLYITSSEIVEERTLPNSFYEAKIIFIPKPDKEKERRRRGEGRGRRKRRKRKSRGKVAE